MRVLLAPGLQRIALDRNSCASLHRQLYHQIRLAIERGDLCSGSVLPSTRAFARMLHVSRNTVSNAYEILCLEGLIVGIAGSCTRVRGVSSSRGFPVAKRLDAGIILRAAHFPQNWARIDDPDGNPLYAYR